MKQCPNGPQCGRLNCQPTQTLHRGRRYAAQRGVTHYPTRLKAPHRGISTRSRRLPDAATWFSGGFAKARLEQPDPAYLERFIIETWRGELCHWSALAFMPVFFLWNPWWGDLIIVAYALGANLPCILAQRYNRIRLMKLKRRADLASRASR